MSADGDDTTPSPYLTAREAAAYLHLNEKTLYALIQDGGIPATKVTGKWLFPRALLDDWLLAHRITWLFVAAMMLALPAMTAVLIVNIAFGVMTKAAPQMNIFSVGFPITIGVGLTGLWLTLPMMQVPFTMAIERMLALFM